MNKVIIKLISATIMFNLSNIFKMLFEMLSLPHMASPKPGTLEAVSANMMANMESLIPLIGITGYFLGLVIAAKAALEFKKYNDEKEGGSVETEEIAPIAVNLEKHAQESIVINKINQEETFDFKDTELNSLAKEIFEKIAYLKTHEYVKKDMESQLMVEKTESEYLYKIYRNYVNIPENKRGKKGMENSPYDLTLKQLKLIVYGLDEIENKIVKDSVVKQKANEIFLKEKVANM